MADTRRHNPTQGTYDSQGGNGKIRRARSPRRYVSELLTLAEVCNRFGLPFQRVWALAESGRIHPVKPRGRILYVEAQIREVLDREGWTPPDPTNLDEARRRKKGQTDKGG